MPAISPHEKINVRRIVISNPTTPLTLTVAVMATPAKATITVTDLTSSSAIAESWSFSADDFVDSSGRLTVDFEADSGKRYQIDFLAYATGPNAEVLFVVEDADGTVCYRKYKRNDGTTLFAPWAAVGVRT